VLQFASPGFDASASEIFVTLLSGATLGLARQESLLPGQGLLKLMREQGTTAVTLPPSVLAVLDGDELPELRTVISAGEACMAEVVARWSAGRRFINAYGPTEVSVCATMSEDLDSASNLSIGRPISNAQVYVLDRHMQPVPVGITGELYVGGSGLARGYLNQPGLTAERFVPDPFGAAPGGRLYRTGDLARFQADGSISFIGRNDHQVKVRGFRVELGEIHAALISHQAITDCAVLAREDALGQQQIVAYLVFNQQDSSPIAELREHLRRQLPDYMIPSAFVRLDKLPLTPNGKLDRKALPAPGSSREAVSTGFAAPATEMERRVAQLWCAVLGLERVGLQDNFFEVGGHSLRLVQVQGRLREELGREVAVVDLFRYPTVGLLAGYLESSVEKAVGGAVESAAAEQVGAERGARLRAGRERQRQRRRLEQQRRLEERARDEAGAAE
jgi:acyl carrier protein